MALTNPALAGRQNELLHDDHVVSVFIARHDLHALETVGIVCIYILSSQAK